jgi:hypothetical protein
MIELIIKEIILIRTLKKMSCKSMRIKPINKLMAGIRKMLKNKFSSRKENRH